MILNSETCHYMCIEKNCVEGTFLHNGKKFKSCKDETILGVIIDKKLTFDINISRICKKAGQKLYAFSRISAFIDFNKRQILFENMVKSSFTYCPLIWMFCSSKSNNLINKTHERSLKIVINDKKSTFEDLLKANNQITVHQKNLQVLMTEVFKNN